MSEPNLAPLSEAQREIMEIIWSVGECSVSDVRDQLAERRQIARNTVQTMIVRMEEKGWLVHRAVGRTFLYSAARPKKATLGDSVRELVNTVFRGSAEDLVTTLLDDYQLSKAEADRIRVMIDEAQERGRKTKKRQSKRETN
jgi:predicted transcriptional regulator